MNYERRVVEGDTSLPIVIRSHLQDAIYFHPSFNSTWDSLIALSTLGEEVTAATGCQQIIRDVMGWRLHLL